MYYLFGQASCLCTNIAIRMLERLKIDLRNDLLLFFTTRYLLDRNFTLKTIKSIAFTIIPLHTYSYIIPILYHLYHTYMS